MWHAAMTTYADIGIVMLQGKTDMMKATLDVLFVDHAITEIGLRGLCLLRNQT